MESAPGIAKDNGGIITSAELYALVNGLKRSTQSKINLPLRGIGPRGLDVRRGISIVEGRMFEIGKNEIIVGLSALKEFSGFELGREVKLGKAMWKVVGVFSAGGSVFESELWTDARTLQSQFGRNFFQIMRVVLEDPGDVSAIEAFIEKDPRLNVAVLTETDYYKEQASTTSNIIFYLGWPLAIAMALGAIAGALNTMYTSVTQRQTEIATLRAIGFSGLSAFIGTLIEALALAFWGGIVGAVAAYLFFDGLTASTISNFSQVVFDFRMSPQVFANGLSLALIIGLIGGFFPALRASRLPIAIAFSRSA